MRDTGTPGHCHTVGRYAELMARELGFAPDHVERIRLAGSLHDIGKTGVSDRLISKPGPLDADEWHSIRTHPEIGARLLAHPEFEDLRELGAGAPRAPRRQGLPLRARGRRTSRSRRASWRWPTPTRR